MQLSKQTLSHGDILHCSSNGFLGRCIKFVTRSTINHTAIVLLIDGEVFISDSQQNGTNLKTLENWNNAYNYQYKIHRYKFNSEKWGRSLRVRALSKIGITGYDFASLLIWQPIYLLTRKWYGRKEGKAEKRMYCSEYVGYCHDIPEFWKHNPDELFKVLSETGFYELYV